MLKLNHILTASMLALTLFASVDSTLNSVSVNAKTTKTAKKHVKKHTNKKLSKKIAKPTSKKKTAKNKAGKQIVEKYGEQNNFGTGIFKEIYKNNKLYIYNKNANAAITGTSTKAVIPNQKFISDTKAYVNAVMNADSNNLMKTGMMDAFLNDDLTNQYKSIYDNNSYKSLEKIHVDYTGHTANDNKRFSLYHGYDTVIHNLNNTQKTEVYNAMASAINSIRKSLGITDQVGTVTNNSNANDLAHYIVQASGYAYINYDANDIQNKTNIPRSIVKPQLDFSVGQNDGGMPNTLTYKSFDKTSSVTLANIKQYLINEYITSAIKYESTTGSSTGFDQIVGTINKRLNINGGQNYVGFWISQMSKGTGDSFIVTLPKNYQNYSKVNSNSDVVNNDTNSANSSDTDSKQALIKLEVETVKKQTESQGFTFDPTKCYPADGGGKSAAELGFN